jgi:hypothetical protein
MKRGPSYSDSYHILARPGTPVLEPLVLNGDADAVIPAVDIAVKEEHPPCYHGLVLFIIKGSLHIFFISTF